MEESGVRRDFGDGKVVRLLAIAADIVAERGLGQEVALCRTDGIKAIVVVALHRGTVHRLTVPSGGDITALYGVVETDEQVAAIVVVRRGERNDHLAVNDAQGTFVNDGARAIEGTDGSAAHFGQEDLEVGRAPAHAGLRCIECHPIDRAAGHSGQVVCRNDILRLQVGVGIKAVHRNVTVGGSTVVYGQFIRSCHACKGEHKRHQ